MQGTLVGFPLLAFDTAEELVWILRRDGSSNAFGGLPRHGQRVLVQEGRFSAQIVLRQPRQSCKCWNVMDNGGTGAVSVELGYLERHQGDEDMLCSATLEPGWTPRGNGP